MHPKKTKWDIASFIMAGKLRLEILLLLRDSPKTPKMLSDKTKAQLSHISRSLSELKDISCVKLLTPERRKARLYDISEDGLEILTLIKEKLES